MKLRKFSESVDDRINIKPEILYVLLSGYTNEADGFKVIEDKIKSSDTEDGGADHEYVIQEISTGRFFKGYYSDWDIENTDYDEEEDVCDGRIDLNCNLQEVFPEQITITVYNPRRK